MTYCYERLINLMKDANLQFENIKVLRMYDNTFEAGLLLCRRVGFVIVSLLQCLNSLQVLLSAMTLSVVRHQLV